MVHALLLAVLLQSFVLWDVAAQRIRPCTFERGMCDWRNVQNDDFDWTEGHSYTPTLGTGPSTDHTHEHTTGDNIGIYLYVEASAPRRNGDRAALYSNTRNPRTTGCLNFYYYMYGADLGILRVKIQKQSQGTVMTLWERNRQPRDAWQEGQVPLGHINERYQVIIEGTIGNGSRSDIAVDDVALTREPCTHAG